MIRLSRILYTAPLKSSFIEQDIELLKDVYHVDTNISNWSNKFLLLFQFIAQFFNLVFKFRKYHFVLISFAGYWSIIPCILSKLFKVPCYIILNGTECASLPSYGYGSIRKKPLKLAIYISLQLSNKLLPVSESLVYSKDSFGRETNEQEQGLRIHFPKIKTPIQIISNAYNHEFWNIAPNFEKEKNSFIAVFSKEQYYLKGGDLITEVSQYFPQFKFYIVGMEKPDFITENHSNLIFMGRLSPDKLRDTYRKSQFHFQLSSFEGFGGALCEAMLCECIPIGSNSNIIPDIIGDSGYILNEKSSKLLIDLINSITNKDNSHLGKIARNRIIANYNLKLRQNKLVNLV